MTWKQPITTNLDQVFGDDYISQDIYIWALLHAASTDRVINLNGKVITIHRGQCYATITNLARRFNRNAKTIKKYLKLLNGLHNVLDNDIYPQGVVLTIKSYDEVIKMDNDLDNDLDNERTTTTERLPTNKNAKNAKSDNTAALEIINHWNKEHGTKYKSIAGFAANLSHWLKEYTLPDILQAISNIRNHSYKKNMDIQIFFRRSNPNHEPVDNIGEMLNLKASQPKKPLTPWEFYRKQEELKKETVK